MPELVKTATKERHKKRKVLQFLVLNSLIVHYS